MKNRNPQRKLRRQDSFDIILIVCEGEKTEIKYFEALKEFYKLQQAVIIAKPNSKSDPCNIVKEAKQEIGENKERYDYVYCVVDIDSHANLKRAKTLVNQHNKSGEKTKITLIASCPCFEYWILLHYENTNKSYYTGSSSPCEQVTKALKKHIKDYKKDYDKFKNVITSGLNQAMKNSKQFQQLEATSSYTEVYQVVEKMLEIKEKREAFLKKH